MTDSTPDAVRPRGAAGHPEGAVPGGPDEDRVTAVPPDAPIAEANEADVAEQRQALDAGDRGTLRELPAEADPADALEQSVLEPFDEDDERRE